MHKALHSRNDRDKLYWSGKEGGRGQASIVDCVDVTIRQLEENIIKSKEFLLTAASNNNANIRSNRKIAKTWKQKWEEKQLEG